MKATATLLVLTFIGGCSPAPPTEAPIVSRSKKSVLSQLKDPDSTQFRNVEICPKNSEMVVGEFNAKNALGAFTGFSFFFAVKSYAYLPESVEPISRNGQTYSFTNQLTLACFDGADPDLGHFVQAVENNKAISVEAATKARETSAVSDKSLKTSN